MEALRWRIEGWHRILKAGCEIKRPNFRIAERMKLAVAVNAATARRMAALTLMGLDMPELPAHRMLLASEIALPLDFAIAGGFMDPCLRSEARAGFAAWLGRWPAKCPKLTAACGS